MAGAKTDVPESMQAGLQALLPDIANCMAAPDADLVFLRKLSDIVLLKIHGPKGPQGAPGAAGGAPGPGAAGAPGGPPGGAPAGMGAPGGPPGGGAPNGQMPGMGAPQPPMQPGGVSAPMTLPPDEIRRTLAEQAGE